MTDLVSGKGYAVGARKAIIFELNASGSPAASGTSPYSGIQMVGVKNLDLTIPDSRKITHTGDDAPLQLDYLPPTEAVSGEMLVAQEDQALYVILTDTSRVTVGEATFVGVGTSKQGFEPQVAMLVYQQALDENGERCWRSAILPRVTLYPHPSGMNENPSQHRYIVSPAFVTAHLWETAFAEGTEGYVRSQAALGQSRYMPSVVAWLASTATTTFALPAAEPGADTAKMAVWVDGVGDTAWTMETTQISTSTAPGNNKRVVCFYEHN